MKLKNKKTGEVMDLEKYKIKCHFNRIILKPETPSDDVKNIVYDSIKDFRDEWVPYKEKEVK